MTLEQGVAIDELVEDQPERECGHQLAPTAGAAWRGAVPHHRRNPREQ